MSEAIVVSDTSPLNYLVQIGSIDLLNRLTSSVLIPPEVAMELSHPKAPGLVRAWLTNPPPWLRIVAPERVDDRLQLDRGEASAISLALERGIRNILIDERKGFEAAKSWGLEPFGTLAILEVSARRGLVDFDDAVRRLRDTNFHCAERLISEARARLLPE